MYPILFKIGPLPLHTFGVILAIAILVGSTHLLREARRLGDPQITEERLQRLIWWVVVSVIAGGRLMHVIVEHAYFARHPLEIVAVWKGGLVMYGGLIAVFIAVVTFAWKHKIRVLRLCDLLAPSAFLGEAIGRWGCFSAGDDYGRPIADKVFGIHFPQWLGVRFTNPDALVPPQLRGVPLHPTQIYMSIKAFTIFLILMWISRRKKFDGQVAGWTFMLYAVLRSFVEFFRGDLDRGFVGPLSTAQFTSIFMFALGLLILLTAPRRTLADDLAAMTAETAPAPQPAARSKRKRRR